MFIFAIYQLLGALLKKILLKVMLEEGDTAYMPVIGLHQVEGCGWRRKLQEAGTLCG